MLSMILFIHRIYQQNIFLQSKDNYNKQKKVYIKLLLETTYLLNLKWIADKDQIEQKTKHWFLLDSKATEIFSNKTKMLPPFFNLEILLSY